VVEVGRTWAGGGTARKDDRVLGRLVGCLDVRAVERHDQLRWQTAGGEAGGQMRAAGVAVAEVDGRVVGSEEEVSDGITWRLVVSLVHQMTTARRYRVFPEGGSPRAHVAQGLPVD